MLVSLGGCHWCSNVIRTVLSEQREERNCNLALVPLHKLHCQQRDREQIRHHHHSSGQLLSLICIFMANLLKEYGHDSSYSPTNCNDVFPFNGRDLKINYKELLLSRQDVSLVFLDKTFQKILRTC